MLKKIFSVFALTMILYGCADSNQPYKYLKNSNINSVTIKHDLPYEDIPHVMNKEDVEELILYLNNLDLSEFEIEEGLPEGNGEYIEINQKGSTTITMTTLKPYLIMESVCYKCPNDEKIFEIVKHYNVH